MGDQVSLIAGQIFGPLPQLTALLGKKRSWNLQSRAEFCEPLGHDPFMKNELGSCGDGSVVSVLAA